MDNAINVHNFLLCLKVEMTIPKSNPFECILVVCLLNICEVWYNWECCTTIHLFMDLCKVMGVDVSTLNNDKSMNLEGYRWDVGLDLPSWTQGEFLYHTLQLFFYNYFLIFFISNVGWVFRLRQVFDGISY